MNPPPEYLDEAKKHVSKVFNGELMGRIQDPGGYTFGGERGKNKLLSQGYNLALLIRDLELIKEKDPDFYRAIFRYSPYNIEDFGLVYSVANALHHQGKYPGPKPLDFDPYSEVYEAKPEAKPIWIRAYDWLMGQK